VAVSIPCPRRCGLQTCRAPLAPFRGLASLATERCLRASVFHPLCPSHDLRTITHGANGLRGNEIKVEHLVTGGTENHEVSDVIVRALAVNVADLQHVANAEAAMRAHRGIMLECELAIINVVHTKQRPRLRRPRSASGGGAQSSSRAVTHRPVIWCDVIMR
jgi:hypothetical protein